jgi:hypothetical protein
VRLRLLLRPRPDEALSLVAFTAGLEAVAAGPHLVVHRPQVPDGVVITWGQVIHSVGAWAAAQVTGVAELAEHGRNDTGVPVLGETATSVATFPGHGYPYG